VVAAAVATIAICVAVAVPEILGDSARLALRYDRARVANGELWRLVTASYVHLTPRHTVLNIASIMLVLAVIVEAATPRLLAALLAGGTLATGIGIHIFAPTVATYVGFSGALYGLLAGGGAALLVRGPRWVALPILAYVALRIGLDLTIGPSDSLVESIGGPVVVAAHICGTAGGVAAAALMLALRLDGLDERAARLETKG
jgi:rhomboid family GlyGly-CTERM serine protease